MDEKVYTLIPVLVPPWYDRIVSPWYDILKNKTEIFFKTKTKQRKLFQEIKHSSYENKSRYKNNHMNRVMAMSVVAMSIKGTGAYENNAHFDTDSTMVGVDNRCSACISSDIKDFDGPVMDTNRTIKGFAGSKVRNVKTGTIAWNWADDQGMIHRFKIPNSYYVPEGHCKLLSPQHFAKAMKDMNGTGEDTNGTRCKLYWKGKSKNFDHFN